MKSVFITATDTGVGKTVASTLLCMGLRNRGFSYEHFKPVQSGAVTIDGVKYPSDLYFSGNYLRGKEGITDYCQKRNEYLFDAPQSPDYAAELEHKIIKPEEIINRYIKFSAENPLVIEGAGGVAVPLVRHYRMYDLIRDIGAPCIIVARSSLGTLNHTFLTAQLLKSKGIDILGIIVSGFDGSPHEKRNMMQMKLMNQLPMLGVLPKINIDTEEMKFLPQAKMAQLAEDYFQWNAIVRALGEYV